MTSADEEFNKLFDLAKPSAKEESSADKAFDQHFSEPIYPRPSEQKEWEGYQNNLYRSVWGAPQEWANAFTFGQGPKIAAGVQYLKGNSGYEDAREGYERARDLYFKEHYPAAMTADLLGGAIPTAAALRAGQEYAVAPLLSRFLSPGAVNVLLGAGGMAMDGGAGMAARLGSRTLYGAQQGAAGAALNSGLNPDIPLGNQLLMGGAVGGVANPLMQALSAPIARSTISPQMAESVQKAVSQGVNIRPGQIPGAPSAIRMLDRLSTGVEPEIQQTQWNKALLREMGIDGEVLDRGTIRTAQDNAWHKITAVSQRNTIDDTNFTLSQRLYDIANNPELSVATREAKAQIKEASRLIDRNITPTANGFELSGDKYTDLIKKGNFIDSMMQSSDPFIRNAGRDLRDALDDAFERSVPPNDRAEYLLNRKRYKDTKVAELLLDQGTGNFDPKNMHRAVDQIYGRAKDGGNIRALADVGRNILPIQPKGAGSAHLAPPALGALGVGLESMMPHSMGGDPTNIVPYALAAGGTYLASRGVNAIAQSPMTRNRLLQNALLGNRPTPSLAISPTVGFANRGYQRHGRNDTSQR